MGHPITRRNLRRPCLSSPPGIPRWVAALTAAPVLLDAYELQMEQLIMPDVWFEALVVAGLAVLLWRPVVSVRFAAVAGLYTSFLGDTNCPW
jgi:hypothetical protein